MFDYSHGTRTRARQNRRDVRAELGPGSTDLPDVIHVLRAARALGALLDNASDGRFGISVHDFSKTALDDNQDIPVGDAIVIVLDARRREQETRQKIIETYGSPVSREYQ
jgi:hypothetical protein